MPTNAEPLASALVEPVHLAAFEGPLDLLLYLVRRSEIDICDIPIAEITHQYMDVIEQARENQLEIAGDFFVMAATLMRIKSRLLLPAPERPQDEDDASDDPRWELAKMLLEYRRFKEAAGDLAERIDSVANRLARRIPDNEPPPPEITPIDGFDVWNAFNAVMHRLADRLTQGSIEPERISVSDCMGKIRSLLTTRNRFLFTDLLPEEGLIAGITLSVNLLAVLELTRLGILRLRQSRNFDDIEILRREQTDPQLATLATPQEQFDFGKTAPDQTQATPDDPDGSTGEDENQGIL